MPPRGAIRATPNPLGYDREAHAARLPKAPGVTMLVTVRVHKVHYIAGADIAVIQVENGGYHSFELTAPQVPIFTANTEFLVLYQDDKPNEADFLVPI